MDINSVVLQPTDDLRHSLTHRDWRSVKWQSVLDTTKLDPSSLPSAPTDKQGDIAAASQESGSLHGTPLLLCKDIQLLRRKTFNTPRLIPRSYITHGHLYTVYRCDLIDDAYPSTPTPLSKTSEHTIPHPAPETVIAKFVDLESFSQHISFTPSYTPYQALEAVRNEVNLYQTSLEPLQGRIVPQFVDFWVGTMQSMDTTRQILVVILEDLGDECLSLNSLNAERYVLLPSSSISPSPS